MIPTGPHQASGKTCLIRAGTGEESTVSGDSIVLPFGGKRGPRDRDPGTGRGRGMPIEDASQEVIERVTWA